MKFLSAYKICPRFSKVAAIIGLAFSWWTLSWSKGADLPNVVFIVADDMGFGDCGVHGHPTISTPHLDSLATEGLNLRRFYSCSPYCSASRLALLTGRYPIRQNVVTVINDTTEHQAAAGLVPLLPIHDNYLKFFRAKGYEIAHFGKWHVSADINDPFMIISHGLGEFKTRGSGYEGSGWDTQWYQNSATFLGSDAVEYIRQQSGQQPFFLQVWLATPHTPVSPFAWQKGRYANVQFDPNEFGPRWEREYMSLVEEEFSGGDFREAMLRYATEISKIDDQVGRIRAALTEKGFAENTIVVFTSDNGPESVFLKVGHNPGCGSTGDLRGRKRNLYEGGIRMPFFAVGPGIPRLTNEATMVTAVDFWPTLAAWAGLRIDRTVDGADLSREIAETERSGGLRFWYTPRSAFEPVEYQSPGMVVSDGRWKLLKDPGSTMHELYDLASDEAEMHNLAGTEQLIESALVEALEAFETNVVPHQPHIFYESPSMDVGRGEAFSLRCHVASVEQPTFQWFKDGIALVDGPGISGSRTYRLTVDSPDSEGEFRCEISSAAGTAETGMMRVRTVDHPTGIHAQRVVDGIYEMTMSLEDADMVYSLSRTTDLEHYELLVEDEAGGRAATYSERLTDRAFYELHKRVALPMD